VIELLPGIIAILGLIGAAAVAAPRLRLSPPVLLALAGIGWSLVRYPAPPRIDPQVVLAVFLPPLLYADAWRASWHDFRRWLRPILSLAIGLVAATILAVGVAAKTLIPDLPWAACFLLGSILSPTDTVAVHAVLSRLRVPRRATAILGGESLINDATGLLGVQLTTAVILTGIFDRGSVALNFAQITGFGLMSGIAVGGLAILLNTYLRGTAVLFVFSLFSPYLAYAVADGLGASGVLAVVTAGFVASWRIDRIAPESRADLYVAWDVLTFVLNALMFLFVGLKFPHGSLGIGFGLTIAIVVIVVRIAWIWPAAYVPLWLSPRLREKEGGYPDPRAVTLVGWCGVRGAVSLAALLALPEVANGVAFPGRAAIESAVVITIAVTLLGQGATLEPLARWLRLRRDPSTDSELRRAREAMLEAGIARLDAYCTEDRCPIAVFRFRDAMSDQLAELRALDESERMRASQRLAVSREVRRAVWAAQTAELLRLRDAGDINDAAHQDLQLVLDREIAEIG
jgi:monovalent cation/hydrogen antiporter